VSIAAVAHSTGRSTDALPKSPGKHGHPEAPHAKPCNNARRCLSAPRMTTNRKRSPIVMRRIRGRASDCWIGYVTITTTDFAKLVDAKNPSLPLAQKNAENESRASISDCNLFRAAQGSMVELDDEFRTFDLCC
jgi:hypothetical protein